MRLGATNRSTFRRFFRLLVNTNSKLERSVTPHLPYPVATIFACTALSVASDGYPETIAPS